MTPTDHLRRREVLAAGAAGLGAFVLGCRPAAAVRSATSASCVLTPEMTEGPYYLHPSVSPSGATSPRARPARRCGCNYCLTVARRGRAACPIPGAVVEIWHSDAAEGVYSGFGEWLVPMTRSTRSAGLPT